jgi:hypothetical protein
MNGRLALLLAAWLAVASPAGSGPARAGSTEVDLALVIAVDVSLSMDQEEQALQRQGFIEAFKAPAVHAAIRGGMLGKIAVTYVEWAGAGNQTVVMPWTLIEGEAEATSFADTLSRRPPRRATWTSISSALDFTAGLFEGSGYEATRRVIDVSGDGPNNQGRLVTEARDAALAKGIVINGLPIMLKEPTGAWDYPNLDLYYRDCVIGGAGAFMVPVRDKEQFVQAVRTKILREVAALPSEARIERVQDAPRTDCRMGERRMGRDWN